MVFIFVEFQPISYIVTTSNFIDTVYLYFAPDLKGIWLLFVMCFNIILHEDVHGRAFA